MLITITSLERLAALEALSQLHDPNDPEPESFLGYVLPAIDRARVAEFVVELAQQEATRLRQIAERQIEVAKEHPIVDLNLGRFWIAEFLGLEPVDPPSADRRPLVDARTAVRMAERAGPYVASLISKELARAQAALSLLVSPSEVARQAEAEAEATGVLEPAHDIIRQPAQAALEPKTVEREWLRIETITLEGREPVVVIICDERLYGDISLDDIIEKTKAFARASETVIKVQAVGDQS